MVVNMCSCVRALILSVVYIQTESYLSHFSIIASELFEAECMHVLAIKSLLNDTYMVSFCGQGGFLEWHRK